MAAARDAAELREALLCPSARGRVFCVVVVCVDACHGGRPGDATTSRCAPGCPRRRRGRPVTGTGLPERQVGRGPDRREQDSADEGSSAHGRALTETVEESTRNEGVRPCGSKP